ncbi:hypothetical protein HK407_03g05360 [Ordospora pajunii]|uniref:uncharacterized protein n=1 Tax=Ordospora pajunii TaxID=3039483 RepID=UPI0029528D48|nr:uncharacterized protein HK407_03g05360 [Ordospora pajunii]KAH9411786.1 hypothetical protein HK407_03g05360 [Ordospora pajunii]
MTKITKKTSKSANEKNKMKQSDSGSEATSCDESVEDESGSNSVEEESGSDDSTGSTHDTESGSGEETSKKEDNPSLTVFIKGISYDLTEYDLKTEMEKIGNVVRVGIPMTNDHKRNKGFGYIEFSNEEEVKKALKLDGTVLLGREVVVNMAQPKSTSKQKYSIYVSNIPFESDRKKLKEYFESMGHVVGVSFPYDVENNRLKGFGFIDFGNKEDYERVLNKSKLMFDDCNLYHKPANGPRGPKSDYGKNRRSNDSWGSKSNSKKHWLDGQNKSNKKVRFDDSDSE